MKHPEFTILPPAAQRIITASVGFISPVEGLGSFLAIKNSRGWDIPGGHVEAGESPFQTLEREVKEESGCAILPGAVQIAVLESLSDPQTGIAVFMATCEVGEFAPTEEIAERAFFSETELLEHYFGNGKLLAALLHYAD